MSKNLKKEIINIIKTDYKLIGKIMTETGVSFSTVNYWLKNKPEQITQFNVLQIIFKHLKENYPHLSDIKELADLFIKEEIIN